MAPNESKPNCPDYQPRGRGNDGYCGIMAYPCINMRRGKTCPRENKVMRCAHDGHITSKDPPEKCTICGGNEYTEVVIE